MAGKSANNSTRQIRDEIERLLIKAKNLNSSMAGHQAQEHDIQESSKELRKVLDELEKKFGNMFIAFDKIVDALDPLIN